MDSTKTMGLPMNGKSQVLTVGAANVTSAGMPAGVQCVRLVASTDCFVAVGDGAAVANTSMFLSAGLPEYFAVDNGWTVSAIRVTADGFLYVTPMV